MGALRRAGRSTATSPNELLKEAETDLAALAGLPREIRAKVKAGIADLTRIRDAIEATIASLTGSAQATLASLQDLATQDAAAAAAEVPQASSTVLPSRAPAGQAADPAQTPSFGA